MLGTGWAALMAASASPSHARKHEEERNMSYKAKDYSNLIGLKGFSDALLNNHFTLYQGYVNNTNKILESLNTMMNEGKSRTPEFAEMKRRLGWEFNGMRLHEYYFDNLCGKCQLDRNGVFARRATEQFAAVESWERDFRATGEMRGIGWVVTYIDPTNGRLFNTWINEHDTGHPAGCEPILVMDVFEHAFMLDYGLKRVDYINAFFQSINWDLVESRIKAAEKRIVQPAAA
jgi:Fe-Mn family superoxide dismutase